MPFVMKNLESAQDYSENYQSAFNSCLQKSVFTGNNGEEVSVGEGLSHLCELSSELQGRQGRKFIVGNGASAAFADHMALDWTKNGKIAARSFGDSAWLTAAANDLGVDQIFSAGIELHGRSSDLLVAVSSSGRSPNIIRAIEKAREMSILVVTFTGLAETNPARALGDLNIYVPAQTYGMVEVAHQYWLHLWLDRYMGVLEWARSEPQDMRVESFKA